MKILRRDEWILKGRIEELKTKQDMLDFVTKRDRSNDAAALIVIVFVAAIIVGAGFVMNEYLEEKNDTIDTYEVILLSMGDKICRDYELGENYKISPMDGYFRIHCDKGSFRMKENGEIYGESP